MAKDVDLSLAELGLVGADGEEGLDGVVCEATIAKEMRVSRCSNVAARSNGALREPTDLICELTPYRDCSRGSKRWGRMAADRSFCMPDCLPRRNEAIVMSLPDSVAVREMMFGVRKP